MEGIDGEGKACNQSTGRRAKVSSSGGGVQSTSIGIHPMNVDDLKNAMVVRIALSEEDILGLVVGRKLHLRLEVESPVEECSQEKGDARLSTYAEAIRRGWSCIRVHPLPGLKTEVLGRARELVASTVIGEVV